jgi:hypothetical protein
MNNPQLFDMTPEDIKEIFGDNISSLADLFDQETLSIINDSNQNNGLITRIWGPAGWIFMHAITFGYPLKPTDEQKLNYYNFFILVGKVLPCIYCRQSYDKFVSEGKTKLMMKDMKNRYTLAHWLYRIHQTVNKKLCVDYRISFKDVIIKYESYRARCNEKEKKHTKDDNFKYSTEHSANILNSLNTLITSQNETIDSNKINQQVTKSNKIPIKSTGCIVPLNYKANSYQNAEYRECVIISLDAFFIFVEFARARGLDKINEGTDDSYFRFHGEFAKYNFDLDLIVKSDIWHQRNIVARELINTIRKEGRESLISDPTDPYLGTPSDDEMRLLLMLSTNMTNEELLKAIHTILCHPVYVNYKYSQYYSN